MPQKSKTKSHRSKSHRSKLHRSKLHLRKTKRNKSQKKYYMVGCNNKKCNCPCHRRGGSNPIGGLQIGGDCSNPLVGSPYSVNKGGNYYNLPDGSAYSLDRNMQMRGGSLIPANLLYAGRQLGYGMQSVVNGLRGVEAPVNPAPEVQYENKI
jgi:hypothetical protein